MSTNSNIVANPIQKITHDESESEKNIIGKQGGITGRSTRGITKDELDEVMSIVQKLDKLSLASPKKSIKDSFNNKAKKYWTVSHRADIGTIFPDKVETSDGSLFVNESFLDTTLQEDLEKLKIML